MCVCDVWGMYKYVWVRINMCVCVCVCLSVPDSPEEWSDKLDELMPGNYLLVEENETAYEVIVHLLASYGLANLCVCACVCMHA